MAEHSVVGPLFSPHLIEEAVLAVLQKWLPGYLTVACEEHGIEEGIEGIKSWGLASALDKWPEQGYPALLVVAPDDPKEIEVSGDGMYRATWPFEVAVSIQGSVAHLARRHAQVYGAAIRGAILQRRSLGDGLQATRWTGGDSAQGIAPDEQRRTIAATANSFEVKRERVVSWKLGPGSDATSIPDTWPIVKEIEVNEEIE